MARGSLADTRWLAVLCIALGSAALTAQLTLLSLAVLRPLPFPDAERLQRVWVSPQQETRRVDLSIPEAEELAGRLASVDAFAIAARSRAVARLPGGAERLRGEAVSANYFGLLGLQPQRGRLLQPADYAGDAAPVALISDAFWRRAYGADPAILGQPLVTEESQPTIVGVLPPGFSGSIENDEVEYWLPLPQYLPAALRSERTARQSWTLARLAEGVAAPALAAELEALGADWRARHADFAGQRLHAEAFGENWRGVLRERVGLLLAAGVLLLLVAAANVALLMLARSLERQRELAVRAALGASRGRLARQLLGETALLVALGGALGALLALPLLRGFLALVPGALPSYLPVGFDPLALGLALGTLGLTALFAGSLPAWLASRTEAPLALGARGQTAAPAQRRWSRLLVAGELAVTLVLLVGGALLARSLYALERSELGYQREGVLRLTVSLDRGEAAAVGDPLHFQRRLQETLAAEPNVQQVGIVWPTLPPWDARRLPLEHPALGGTTPTVGVHAIDAGLLDALAIGLRQGRGIEPADVAAQRPVALVSASLAERLGGAAVLNTRLRLQAEHGAPPGSDAALTVVGIVEDVAWDGFAEQGSGRPFGADELAARRLDVYTVIPPLTRNLSLAVSTRADPLALLPALRARIAALAPGAALHWTGRLADELAVEYAATRFHAALLLSFAASALLLAASGLFASLSHGVASRRGEFGIRLALGADGRRLAGEVWREGARIAALALLPGLLAAVAAAQLLQALLFGIDARDPLSFLLGLATLLVLSALALVWPARRAARLQPLPALQAAG